MTKTLIGVLTDVNDTLLVLDNKTIINHNNVIDLNELRYCINSEVMIEVKETEKGLIALGTKAIAVTSKDELQDIMNLCITKKENPYSELTLDMAKINEEAIQETAYCVKQERFMSLRSTYYTFTLKDKLGRVLKANLFTDEEVVDMSESIIIVSILRKGNYYNLDKVILQDSVVLKNPLVEISKEYIRKMYKDNDKLTELVNKLIEIELNEEQLIKFAYQVNLASMYRNIVDFNIEKVLNGIAYEKLSYIKSNYKSTDERLFNSNDIIFLNSIVLKVFDTDILSLLSKDSEYYTKEKEIFELIIANTNKLYNINFEFDYRRLK